MRTNTSFTAAVSLAAVLSPEARESVMAEAVSTLEKPAGIAAKRADLNARAKELQEELDLIREEKKALPSDAAKIDQGAVKLVKALVEAGYPKEQLSAGILALCYPPKKDEATA